MLTQKKLAAYTIVSLGIAFVLLYQEKMIGLAYLFMAHHFLEELK